MMLRKLFIGVMCLTLAWTSFAVDTAQAGWFGFGNDETSAQTAQTAQTIAPTPVTEGSYAVQQAEYNDANGEYTLMLLGTPSGQASTYRSDNLQMARTGDDEPIAGTYLGFSDGQPVLHLTEDFRIEYVHAVTETQNNPQTGQPETVIVRRESNFWSPFAGAIAGNLVANALFAPRYYVPPIYSPGIPMMGYGGVGTTYNAAVSSYQQQHNSPPPAVKNRTTLRTSGNLRSNASRTGFGSKNRDAVSSAKTNNTQSSGSGFGASNLRSSGNASRAQRRSTGFGSGGRSPRPARSFSGRRR